MKLNKFSPLLTLLMIAISGNPATGILGKETVYIGSLMIFLILWWFKPLKLTRQDILLLVLFVVLTLTQVLIFGSISATASFGFLVKLSIALLAVRLIPEFSRHYVFVMYVLSLISLAFFIPTFLGVDMQALFATFRLPLSFDIYHIGIHNLSKEYDGSVRNMGMFWEPGAFAGYLILALFFLIRDSRDNIIIPKHGLVLIVTLLTTQSTTGYLVFMVLVIFYLYTTKLIKGKVTRLLFYPGFILALALGAYVATNEVSFLGEKINKQIESASVRDDASRINRFGNFLYDLEWIAKRPILGWSANPATRSSIDAEAAELIDAQGNGLTGFAVKFGLAGLLIFVGFFAFATRKITCSLSATLFGIVIVCALLNGEQFLNFPIFLSLMFMPKYKSRSRPLPSGYSVKNPILAGKITNY